MNRCRGAGGDLKGGFNEEGGERKKIKEMEKETEEL